MLVWLAEHFLQCYSGFKIFSCLTFRAIISLLTAMCISFWTGNYFITYLNKLQINQVVRNDGPKSHFSKRNTPTMGGLIVLTSIIFSVFLWIYPISLYVWCILFVLVGYGILGFIDDYRKIIDKDSKGLIARWKYFWQSIIAIIVIFIISLLNKNIFMTQSMLPFFKSVAPQFYLWYLLLAYFSIVGTSNAVNLTDGLDGLAILPTVFVAFGLAIAAWDNGNIHLSGCLNISDIKPKEDLIVICFTIMGSGLGFLWFNTYPAQIFMGDVGSLSLGGALGTIAVFLRQEYLLFIMGGLFVLETMSVILQISLFKLYGQRIFRMAPIHHHYELKGCPEPRITVRLWIIAFIFVIIGLGALKVQ